MYTIKEASARTGVGAPLIRAWERRYGVVKPARTASGYRLYDEGALRVLLAMRALVESGWTASEAARAIGAGEVSVDEVVADPRHPRLLDLTADDHRARLVTRFVEAAAAASPTETEAVLDEVLASGSFEAIVDDLLMPATAALGDAWAAGRLSVAAEHAASAAVARRLSAIYQAAGVPGRVSVVVGLPPGARHELGALAFAAALRRRGVGVLYLGPDVTVDGWVDAVASSRARGVVLGAITGADAESAAAVVEALRPLGVRTIAMGGAAATAEAASRLGVVPLPSRIVDAATMVAQTAGRRG